MTEIAGVTSGVTSSTSLTREETGRSDGVSEDVRDLDNSMSRGPSVLTRAEKTRYTGLRTTLPLRRAVTRNGSKGKHTERPGRHVTDSYGHPEGPVAVAAQGHRSNSNSDGILRPNAGPDHVDWLSGTSSLHSAVSTFVSQAVEKTG
jgi:hypothetical protein